MKVPNFVDEKAITANALELAGGSWKPYPLNKAYMICSDGRCMGWMKGHHFRRIVKPYMTATGYYCYKLKIQDKTVTKPVHRVVAETFLPNPNGFEGEMV